MVFSVLFSMLSSLHCHLLVANLIIDQVGASEVAKYVALDIILEQIYTGRDGDFSLSTLDVLEKRISL